MISLQMDKPLKFCMITTFYPPYNFGGDGIYIQRLAHELALKGHRVDVVHCQDAYRLFQKKGVGTYPQEPRNVRVFCLKSRAGFLSPLATYLTGVPFFKRRKIRRLIDENGYDVIHYHNVSLIGIATLRLGHALKLYTMHEHWLVCPMHVLWQFNREACRKRSCLLCTLSSKRPPQFWRYLGLRDRMLRHVDGFISPSRFTRDKHHELGLNVEIRHIPYFLPSAAPANGEEAQTAGPGRRRPFFLFVGRLEKIKGLQHLIPVMRQLPEYDLLVAGEGRYADVLRRVAGDAPNVLFLGRLDHRALRRLYAETIAVIVPSVCFEVFGIIIIEAFAARTPVIVNDFGAMPEVIEDSGGGFVYRDEAELIAAMRRLAGDGALRRELGEKGHLAYLKYWSEGPHLDQYLAFIREIRERSEERRAQGGEASALDCGAPTS
jgi:glycosyltransferase involved in cell wall biosynthesis